VEGGVKFSGELSSRTDVLFNIMQECEEERATERGRESDRERESARESEGGQYLLNPATISAGHILIAVDHKYPLN
jgi:hypothetical protein